MQQEEQEDETITRVKNAIEPITDEIDNDLDSVRTVIVIAGKSLDGENGEMEAIQSYVNVSGDLGIAQEALYAELIDQIQNNNNYELFQALREVIKNIEEELNIDPEDPLEDGPRVIH
jgi:hypothetical protein